MKKDLSLLLRTLVIIKQMVIRFQAAILDWEASVELEENLNKKLSELPNENFTYAFTGDDLIVGMVTEEISTNSVVSTAIVSIIILIMLITINFFDNKDPIRGIVMALPLFVVVCWLWNAWTSWILIKCSSCDNWCINTRIRC